MGTPDAFIRIIISASASHAARLEAAGRDVVLQFDARPACASVDGEPSGEDGGQGAVDGREDDSGTSVGALDTRGISTVLRCGLRHVGNPA